MNKHRVRTIEVNGKYCPYRIAENGMKILPLRVMQICFKEDIEFLQLSPLFRPLYFPTFYMSDTEVEIWNAYNQTIDGILGPDFNTNCSMVFLEGAKKFSHLMEFVDKILMVGIEPLKLPCGIMEIGDLKAPFIKLHNIRCVPRKAFSGDMYKELKHVKRLFGYPVVNVYQVIRIFDGELPSTMVACNYIEFVPASVIDPTGTLPVKIYWPGKEPGYIIP